MSERLLAALPDAPPAWPTALLGKAVGNYRIEALLGQGGMGAVFLAVHQQIGKRAAVKILAPELSRDVGMVGRFLNEARAVNLVHHPGLVSCFEFGRLDSGEPYLIMEYLAGEPLSARLERGGLRLDEALRLSRQIASALTAAHQGGVVHRDLKPANIMLVADPEVPEQERIKLLDFGIAKLSGAAQGALQRTGTGAVLGTPAYMAPEQCRGDSQVGDRADVYALGVLLYELCAGRLPFEADLPFDLMNLHVYGSAPDLRALRPGLPEALARLCHAMLSKEPQRRPAMREVAELLLVLQRELPPAEAKAPPGPGAPQQVGLLSTASALGERAGSAAEPLTLAGTEPGAAAPLSAAAEGRPLPDRRSYQAGALALSLAGLALLGGALVPLARTRGAAERATSQAPDMATAIPADMAVARPLNLVDLAPSPRDTQAPVSASSTRDAEVSRPRPRRPATPRRAAPLRNQDVPLLP